MAYRLGVDVGGTFTDLFLVSDGNGGGQYRVKTPSTPADPSEGVIAGVRRICEEAGIDVGDLRNILHGTTVATNAVLESKGARVGLITTQGFKQILHLARSQTPGPLAGWIIMIKPDPPALLSDTREAVERMDARGETVVPVDEAQVEEIVRDLVESGVESLTVGLVNSYVSGAHEQTDRGDRRAAVPGLPGDALLRGAAGVPRVRAHAHGLHELLRAAQGGDLRRAAAASARADRRPSRGQHPALGRRADDDARGRPQPDLRDPLRPLGRRRRGAVRGPQGGLRRHPHVRHGRHVHRRGALPERPADDRPRDVDQPLPDQGAVGQREHGRGRGRLDRPRAGADEGASRRPAVGRAPTRGRPPTAWAASSRR